MQLPSFSGYVGILDADWPVNDNIAKPQDRYIRFGLIGMKLADCIINDDMVSVAKQLGGYITPVVVCLKLIG